MNNSGQFSGGRFALNDPGDFPDPSLSLHLQPDSGLRFYDSGYCGDHWVSFDDLGDLGEGCISFDDLMTGDFCCGGISPDDPGDLFDLRSCIKEEGKLKNLFWVFVWSRLKSSV